MSDEGQSESFPSASLGSDGQPGEPSIEHGPSQTTARDLHSIKNLIEFIRNNYQNIYHRLHFVFVTFTVNVFGIALVTLIISLTTEFNSLSTSIVSYSKLDTGHYFDLLKEAYQIELSEEKQTHDVDNRKLEWDKLKEAREINSQIIVATNRFLPVLDLVKGAPNWCVLFFQFYGGDFCAASSPSMPDLPGGNPNSNSTDAKLPTEPNVHSPDSATVGIRPRSNRAASKVELRAKGLSPPETISARANGTPVVINRVELERFASEQGFTTTSWNQINTIYLIKGTAPNIIYFMSSSILPLLYRPFRSNGLLNEIILW